MAGKIRMKGVISDSEVQTPPAGRATLYYNDTDKVYKAKLSDGTIIVFSITQEMVEDFVGALLQDSSTINVTYDDAGNALTLDVIQTALNISLIPNVPSGNLTSTNVQAALNELQSDIDTRALNSDLLDHINNPTDAHDASAISVVPSGNLSSTDVQAALVELQTDIDTTNTNLNDHINDTTDAHDASAISVIPAGNLSSTDVQAALVELQTDIDTRALNSDLLNHINNPTDAHDASAISVIPAGNLSSTDVQAALVELQTDIDTTNTNLNNHINNPTDAHDASAISVVPSGNLSSTDVQAALVELQTDIDNIILNAQESAQDAIGAAIAAGTQDGISVVYDDANDKIDFTNTDKGSVAVAAHVALSDPHPQYETSAEVQAKVDAHANLTNNPHNVTKAQVGLGNVPNIDATQRANHTGTQLSSTISDFSDAVRSTLLTGISFVVSTAIVATDSVLQAFGKLQAQLNKIFNIFTDTKEPTGFLSRSDSALAFDPITRTLSISPVGSDYFVYVKGTKLNITSPLTKQIPNITGIYFFYIDVNGVLDYSNTFDISLLSDKAYVSFLYWDSNAGKAVVFADERHGITMDHATHQYLHTTRGTQLVSGGAISFNITGDGTSDSHAQIGLSDLKISDEDIVVNINHSPTPSNPFEQVLFPIAKIPVFYRLGSGYWTKDVSTNFPLKVGTLPQFNKLNLGVWSTIDVTSGKFVSYYIGATTDINEPVIALMGQKEYDSVEEADLDSRLTALDLGDLPLQEFKLLYVVIFEVNSTFTNSVKAAARKVIDFRRTPDSTIPTSGTVGLHSNLAGLGADDHIQYLLVSGARQMSGDLNMGGNQIINVGNVDGVDVSSHASRHLPNGADPLTTGTPSTIGTTNFEGIANAFARQDHIHDHGSQTNPNHHAVATLTANGFMSSTDKAKLDGISGQRIFKSGNVPASAFTGAPRTATVTFSTPMPNTNYAITITGEDSRSWRYQNKTVNGFTINSGANGALTGEVSWIAISNGETVE